MNYFALLRNSQYHLSEFERQEIEIRNHCVMEYEWDLKTVFAPFLNRKRENEPNILFAL